MFPKFSFNIKLLIGFIIAIVIITIINVQGVSTIQSTRLSNGWVAHTRDVIDRTEQVRLALTGAQGFEIQYLLSKDERSLNQYLDISERILPSIRQLRDLVSDNPRQVRNVDSLAKYTAVQLSAMNGLLQSSAKSGGVIQDDAEDCRKLTDLIISNEKKLLVLRRSISEGKMSAISGIIMFSTVIVVSLLISLFVFISSTFKTNQRLKDDLQLSESIFSGVFNDSGIGMATVSLQGKVMNINPYLLQLLGYTREELMSKTFQDITHPDDLEADLKLLKQVLAGEKDTYKLEKRYFHKEGNIIWAMLTVSIARNKDNTPRFFVAQIEDITETRQLIQKLELKNQVLLQTSTELESKLRQLQDFNGIVAHNLRGPADGIEMMLGMIIDEKDAAEKENMLELVYKSSKSMNGTLKDLMQILEIRLNQGIEYSNCDLKEATQRTVEMLQGEILRSKAKIITDFFVPTISFPKIYLESVFYNMVSNSLKYKKEGEPVTIRITSVQQDGKVKLTFEDDGLGIDLERHGKHMFKLNKVFHQGYDSKGVGLFITKNQLETHGGTISVQSMPDQGTKFTIYLPQSEVQAELS